MREFVEILRPINCIMAVVGVIVGAVAAGIPVVPVSMPLVFASVAVFLITGAGMVINDYYDYEIDMKSKPFRPLPSGRMERSTAKNLAMILFALGIVFSFLTNVSYVFYLAIFNVIVAYVYATHMKKTWTGNFVVSYLTASTFIYGSLLSNSVVFLVWLIFAISFFASMGRELSKSIEDYKFDKAMHAKTLAVTLGLGVAGWVVAASSLVALALSFLPYVYNIVGSLYLPVIIVADAVLIYAAWLVFEQPNKAQRIFKAAMAVALLAFVAGLL